MKTAEEHLLIFERHFSPEKRCRPPLVWWIMPSACFSAPPPGGLVEGASAGRHEAAGAAWVDLPLGKPVGRASRERASQYPQRSRPSEQRIKNRQMVPALRVAAITGRRLRRLRAYSPRGCSREAALSAPPSCRNGLYAIKSVLP